MATAPKTEFDDYGFPVYKKVKTDETQEKEKVMDAGEIAKWITAAVFIFIYIALACIAGYLSYYDFIAMSPFPRFMARVFAILFNFVYIGWKIFRHYFGGVFSKMRQESVVRYSGAPTTSGMMYPPPHMPQGQFQGQFQGQRGGMSLLDMLTKLKKAQVK